ncbi:MAG: MBL fold metallo-hydrolase [Candidatus Limnocylindria bacterium]
MTVLTQVAPGVRRVEIPLPIPALKIVNAYLIEGDRGWALVDTGIHTAEAERALDAALVDAGIDRGAIGRVFVTHLHPDHLGMAGMLERAGAEVVMHRPEAERARETWAADHRLVQATHEWFASHGMPAVTNDGMRDAWIAMRRHVDAVERMGEVEDGALVDLGGREMRVVWTPGHTDFHAMLVDDREGILIAGDHVLPRITSNVGWYSFSRDDPLGDFLGSLRAIRGLPVRRVLPAHGEPFDDLAGRVDELLAHHEARLHAVLDALGDDERDAYSVCRDLFPVLRSPHEERFALAETLAHLRHLERRGGVVTIERRPVHWRRRPAALRETS